MINSRILIIDDHPIITEAYRNSILNFAANNEGFIFHMDTAFCCDSALLYLNEFSYDVVFLDISLPTSKDQKFKSGEDLGIFIKKKFSTTKIIVITGYQDSFVMSRLLEFLNPDALLYKGDLNSDTCSKSLISILNNIPFYSSSILALIRKKLSSEIRLSKTEKILLYEIEKGTKTKDLSDMLHMSVGAVEKRKRYLKEVFNIDVSEDSALITAAKEIGFI
ncbi:response regulator [Psychroserpens sp.]